MVAWATIRRPGISSTLLLSGYLCISRICDGHDLESLMGEGGMPDFSQLGNMGGMGGMGGRPAPVAGPTKPLEEDELVSQMLSSEDIEAVTKNSENHEFQAEVTRLLDMIINSFYTNREVFLRELISNSADALEKQRYIYVKEGLGEADEELCIKIETDAENKTISILDNGIGMTKEELISNLGVLANSGTMNFLERHTQQGDTNLIGQFGVGFYSAYLVADEVTVVSRGASSDQYVWRSAADKKFTVVRDPRGNTMKRGTRLILKLKDDATTFVGNALLKDYITTYSQFVSFPIYLKVEKTEETEVDDPEEKDAEGNPKKKKVSAKKLMWEQINVTKALWMRPKEEIADDEYVSFYKSIAKDYTGPITWSHFTAEGEIEFRSILFIPPRAPTDLFDNYFSKPTSIKLHVRRVLVAETIEDILPKYLHFIKGVVDSDDLPLNVSREQLQQSRILKVITRKLVRKGLEMMRKLMKDTESELTSYHQLVADEADEEKKAELKKHVPEDKYSKFYSQFARNLKLGCYEDDANRPKIVKLLKFQTSESHGEMVPFEKILTSMPKEQQVVYYAAGESADMLDRSDYVQYFKGKKIPVLYLTEAMDEPCLQKLTELDGRKFESVQKTDLTLPETDDEKVLTQKIAKKFEPLLTSLQKVLGSSIMKAEVSKRLTLAPCAVVASKYGYSGYMEKVMKTQTFADPSTMRMMMSQRVLEVNPKHPTIQMLLEAAKKNELDKYTIPIRALYQSAMLASGFDLEDSRDLVEMTNQSIMSHLGVSEAALKDVDVSDVELDDKTSTDDAGDADDTDDMLDQDGSDSGTDFVDDTPPVEGGHDEL